MEVLKYCYLLLFYIMLAPQGYLASKSGNCPTITKSVASTKLSGRLYHRGLYLDVFEGRPLSSSIPICQKVDWPNHNSNQFTILGTDDMNFLVTYKCTAAANVKSYTELAFVYTTDKNPTKETLQAIDKALSDNKLNPGAILSLCDGD